MRASRLLTIQMLLQTRGRMSAQALAEVLEVSVRTLYRDVDQLTAAGVPIYAEQGRNGGFQLVDGWKTTLTGFTASEAQAVFMSGLAGPAAELGLGEQVVDAQLKLISALPAHQRDDAQRVQSRFHLDPADWYREADPVPHLSTVATAVWEGLQLTLRYESWKAEVQRTVHPLGLVLKAGVWYLVATSEAKPRTYRISNILEATVLDKVSVRPKRFDLPNYWADSIQRFEAELYQGQAVVRANAQGMKQLRQLSSAVAQAIAAVPRPQGDETVRLKIPIETLEQASYQLLRMAPDVEVLSPAALRNAIVRRLQAIQACYAPES
ncbi:MAG: YafY family protein [Rhodoferax sp.]|nr:YafY family protein [Rhodoferax sp.]